MTNEEKCAADSAQFQDFYAGVAMEIEAQEQSGEENPEPILAMINNAIHTFPDNGYFYYFRGMTYSSLDDYKAALSDLTKAVSMCIDPGSMAEAYSQRGQCYENGYGKPAEAQADYLKALELYRQVLITNPEEAEDTNATIEELELRVKNLNVAPAAPVSPPPPPPPVQAVPPPPPRPAQAAPPPPVQAPPPPPPPVGGAGQQAACPSCGAALPPGSKFCASCGAPVPVAPQKKFCSNCGAQLVAGAKFCSDCGTQAG
jgi:tetratricopeptide (TPR) repeat protein/predicted nucleic acid-binding Zn ribbon protein